MGIFSAVFAGMLAVLLSESATPALAASAENDAKGLFIARIISQNGVLCRRKSDSMPFMEFRN